MSALTRNRSTATVPNDLMLKYYLQRAKGGAGLIVSEGILITRQGYSSISTLSQIHRLMGESYRTEWQQAPGLWNKAQVEGWKKITDAVHEAGSKIYAQLGHVGRLGHPDAPEQVAAGVPVYGPSALAARGGKFRFLPGEPGYVTPTEMADPTVIIAQFKEAAINAKEAGFDGVELHGANGYLVHQFLDHTSNKRTDKWGGSPENRTRFALEILKEFKAVWGADVALRISPASGYNDMGMPLQDTIDTFGHLLREAEALGLSYVALLRYLPLLDPEIDGKKRATQFDVLQTLLPFLLKTPIFVNGGVTPAEAEDLIGNGKAAGVFMGINWIAHPDLGRRIREGKPLDNVPDFMTFYGVEGVDPALGYIDYKEATY
ncbi:Oxidored-FMN domain-containing protein [Mycena sanguinolenta]|uniref:Oxidored-FMN domain-containing protein n=1 Tax=Mycena sanguinolenta TaxID=230812 RepID=A0A8H7D6K4_9AGAR|nr:Oxidored-FMN domain-containing protein [Mycena sanguinolenta]